MTEIKICGLYREEDIAAVNKAMPDFVGFVINYPESHRSITPKRARELKLNLSPKIKTVGVFVDEKLQTICSLFEDKVIDYAQLHGSEDGEFIKKLQSFGCKVIKSFVCGEEGFSPEKINSCPADFVLLDSGRGGGARLQSSALTGVTRPYFLAGGLTPENIGEAIEKFSPYAVDISSGVETCGKKDFEKIMRAVEAARRG